MSVKRKKQAVLSENETLKYCRTCAQQESDTVPIISEENDGRFQLLLEKYLCIKVSDMDRLPLQLCRKCAETLTDFQTLAEGAIKAQSQLEVLLFEDGNVENGDNDGGQKSDSEDDDVPLSMTLGSVNKKKKGRTKKEVAIAKKDENTRKISDCTAARDAIPAAWRLELSCGACSAVGTTALNGDDSSVILRCPQCDREVIGSARYIAHLKIHGNASGPRRQLTCKNCGRAFRQESHLIHHEKVCGLEAAFPCETCGKRCDSQEAAKAHASAHHKSCVCHFCGSSFRRPVTLRHHVQTVHEDTRMVCHFCGKSFNRKVRLQEHLQRHTGQMDFRCHICGKGSTNAYAFSVHLATHTDEKPFRCSFCPSTFKHTKYVYLHERAVHFKVKQPKKRSNNLEQRTCSECGHVFQRESAMLIHKRSVHEGKNGYICSICGKDFKYTYLLYIHRKKHHFPELCKYVCQYCQKPFPVKGELERHQRKHTGDKPFVCSTCGKRYAFHGSLNMHVRTQHQANTIRKFPCSLCDVSFNFRSHLLRHMTAHVTPNDVNTFEQIQTISNYFCFPRGILEPEPSIDSSEELL